MVYSNLFKSILVHQLVKIHMASGRKKSKQSYHRGHPITLSYDSHQPPSEKTKPLSEEELLEISEQYAKHDAVEELRQENDLQAWFADIARLDSDEGLRQQDISAWVNELNQEAADEELMLQQTIQARAAELNQERLDHRLRLIKFTRSVAPLRDGDLGDFHALEDRLRAEAVRQDPRNWPVESRPRRNRYNHHKGVRKCQVSMPIFDRTKTKRYFVAGKHVYDRIARIALNPSIFSNSTKTWKAVKHLDNSLAGYNPRIYSSSQQTGIQELVLQALDSLERDPENPEAIKAEDLRNFNLFVGIVSKYFSQVPSSIIQAAPNDLTLETSVEAATEIKGKRPDRQSLRHPYSPDLHVNGHHQVIPKNYDNRLREVRVPPPRHALMTGPIGLPNA